MSRIPNIDAIDNLDALDDESLAQARRAFGALSRYCLWIEAARFARASGHVDNALRHEARAETIYQGLPPEWRW